MRRKILVIDNDAKTRAQIRQIVSQFEPEWQVIEACEANRGRVKFLTTRPDLILLDVSLPDMDGLKVMEQIRRISKTPIIVLFTAGSSNQKTQAQILGANAFLVKPIDSTALIAELHTYLRFGSEYDCLYNL